MSEDPVQPVSAETPLPIPARGRPADLWATLIAAFGTIVAVLAAIWFFAGFAENDTRPEQLLSALALTLCLFLLAVGPFAVVAGLARRAYRRGGQSYHYVWTLFLMLPWVGLGLLSLTHTPLPAWVGIGLVGLSSALALWALVSLLLDWRNKGAGGT